ncbi:drug/metabolite transporter (DMT)-like permease [Anaerobacterium chartisolvens]|uniref:Drug/metabolite transporter (DMT)-like permease n=1 Tax=Anaerobacterium chartisolvens TaxID=1297424 RepID=A0A369BG03_9FIRM|nr:DMT family transporter [Anaerobacterium chartisolvens]RCX19407.1 drug/metabolite transporter (DMT)-like permease [Anaerobacterium chartisolvens]
MDKIKNNPAISGIMYAITSCFIFSIMNVLVKAAASSIPSNEIVFFRSIIGTVMILFFMKKEKVPFSKTGIPMLALRGCCGALYMIFYFYTIANMPLLDAIVLINTSPIFSILLSRLFLKEKNPRSVYVIMPIVLIGAMLTIKPFGYSTFSAVAFLGILAALFSGAAGICIRYLGQRHHTYEIIFYFMVTAAIVSIPLMWNEFVVPNPKEWFYLTCIGVISLLAQVFLTKAFTHENAVVVEVVRYIGIAFNAFWGFVFWMEIPDVFSVIGTVVIVGGCIAMTKMKSKKISEKIL